MSHMPVLGIQMTKMSQINLDTLSHMGYDGPHERYWGTAMTEEDAINQILGAMRDSLPSVPRWIFVNSSINPIGVVDLGFSVSHHPALKDDEVVIEYRNGLSQLVKLV